MHYVSNVIVGGVNTYNDIFVGHVFVTHWTCQEL